MSASVADGETYFTVRAGVVYWFVTNRYANVDPRLHAFQEDGGRAAVPIRAHACTQLLAGPRGLYWVRSTGDYRDDVWHLPMSDGAPLDLDASRVRKLAADLSVATLALVDDDCVLVRHTGGFSVLRPAREEMTTTSLEGYMNAATSDAASLYFHAGGALHRVAKGGGGAIEQVRAGITVAGGIHVDGNELYLDCEEEGIVAVSKDGSTLRVLAAPSQRVTFTGLDGTHVYWVERRGAGGELFGVPKRGGATETIGPVDALHQLVLDGSYVYWAGGDDIRRMAKPGTPLPPARWSRSRPPVGKRPASATSADRARRVRPPRAATGPSCPACRTPPDEHPESRRELRVALEAVGFAAGVALDDDLLVTSGRRFRADGEDIAEGRASRIMSGELAEWLAERGAHPGEVTDERSATRVSLRLDGHRRMLCKDGEDAWSSATRRLVRILNTRLARAGAPERLHVLGGGNDQWLVPLTPMQCWLFRRSGEPEGLALRRANPP